MGLLDIWNKKGEEKTLNIKATIDKAIAQNKSITISYRNFNGETSDRTISNIYYNNKFEGNGYYNEYIRGFCSKRQEERTFKIDRIISIKLNE